MTKYYLDPDFRRNPPTDHKGNTLPHCCRCNKQFKDKGNFFVCEVDYNTMEVWLTPDGNSLIGTDCWKQVSKK